MSQGLQIGGALECVGRHLGAILIDSKGSWRVIAACGQLPLFVDSRATGDEFSMMSDVSQHFEHLDENKQQHLLVFSLATSSSIIARHGCPEELSHWNKQLIRIGPMMKKGTAKPIIVQIVAIASSSIPRVPMEPFRSRCLCVTFAAEMLKQKVDFNEFFV